MKIAAAALVVAVASVDAAIGAAIAGIFSVVNTVLIGRLSRRADEARRELASPRRILHDDDGRAVATVIAHEPDPPDAPRRRAADHIHRRRTDT